MNCDPFKSNKIPQSECPLFEAVDGEELQALKLFSHFAFSLKWNVSVLVSQLRSAFGNMLGRKTPTMSSLMKDRDSKNVQITSKFVWLCFCCCRPTKDGSMCPFVSVNGSPC